MEIRINEKVYEYISDFPDGWKFSHGDYFKCPVTIGSNNCFIKRFDKKTDSIAGWNLLNDLSEAYEPNLARVYYVASQDENAITVNYVFFEYIEGRTLYELTGKKVSFDFVKLTDGLFAALQTLEKRGHWFPDFFEKNMFINSSGNFLLIDLDNAQPLRDLPDREIWGYKDYCTQVFKFYQEILHLTDIKPSYFHGSSFNYLHAVFLILRLKLFYLNGEVEYDEVNFFDQLPHRLNNISPSFKKIFSTVYEKRNHPLDATDIDEIKQLIHKEILPLTDAAFNGIALNKGTAQPAFALQKTGPATPVIKSFKTSKAVIRGSGLFKLSWVVEHASRVALYKNGVFYKEFQTDETSIEMRENYEGSVKHLRYSLHAANSEESIRSETVNVNVEPKSEIIKILAVPAALLAILALIYLVVLMRKPTIKSTINEVVFDTVLQGDTVTFTGTNIPEDGDDVEVKFNDVPAKIVRLTIDTIQAQVPQLQADSNVNIMIYIRNKEYTVAQHLRFDASPSFAGFKKDRLIQNEVVTIKGQNLPIDAGTIQLLMNNSPVKIIQQTPDSIRIVVPGLSDKMVNITAFIGGAEILVAQNLVYQKSEVPIIPTTIDPISQRTITEGDIVTISGNNIPKRRRDIKVQFNNTTAAIIQQSAMAIKVQVPSLDKDVSAVNITVIANGQAFNVGKNIEYQQQQVVIFTSTQTKIIEGENLFISGKNIPTGAGAVTVLFNSIRGRITDQSPTLIQVIIPPMPPNTRQADVVVQINDREQLVAKNITYQPLKQFVNACEMAVLSSGTYKTGFLRLGNKHIELTLKNNSKFIMDHVIVSINYVSKKGETQSEELEFINVAPGASVNQRSKKDLKDATVKFEVKSVTTKDFGVQKCKQ